MIQVRGFLEALRDAGIGFVTGVPDSLMKEVCNAFSNDNHGLIHVVAPNEGSAVGLAIGHFLGRGRPALVYLQNSGLGNVINPLVSLAAPEVYGIPLILLIGWRGEVCDDGTQVDDEPQHRLQGRITQGQLDLLDIPYRILDGSSDVRAVVADITTIARKRSGPVAILVRRDSFSASGMDWSEEAVLMTREEAIVATIKSLPEDALVVATTGKASRELYELRERMGRPHYSDFLTVGGMGHASQIAAGIALARPDRRLVLLDGDGALLMHLGGLAITAQQENLLHVVLNNGAHDSVGGQPTCGVLMNLTEVAKGCGFGKVQSARTVPAVLDGVREMYAEEVSSFLEIKCRRGARSDLGRPRHTPAQGKVGFMNFIR